MKKTILSAMAIIMSLVMNAQDVKMRPVGNVELVVSYKLDQLCDNPNQWREEKTVMLEVGGGRTHSYAVEEHNNVMKSIAQFKKKKNAWRLDFNIQALIGETFVGVPEKGELTQIVNLDAVGVYQYTEAVPKMKWKIENERKKVLDYECQRATCSFRGRDYEAWFTEDVPLSFGPWKFGGLPGLILEVADTKREYIFTAMACTVTAIIPDCPRNTQFHYEAFIPFSKWVKNDFNDVCCTFVRINPNAEHDSLADNTFQLVIRVSLYGGQMESHLFHTYRLVPLTQLRTDYPNSDVHISTSYVHWFMLLGLLVILCSMANYLITMVSHLRRRAWEFSLRRVLGASRGSIINMVSIETLLVFLISAALSLALTWLVLPQFREYSGIDLPLSDIGTRLAAYLIIIIAASMMLSALTAWTVMWRTQHNILSSKAPSNSPNWGRTPFGLGFPPVGGLRGLSFVFCYFILPRRHASPNPFPYVQSRAGLPTSGHRLGVYREP